jgi:AcrR family transcriptional regulator
LLATRGCERLSIREVAQAARVNPGMFHYHFRTREAYLRALLQQTYEEMFARLSFEVARSSEPRQNLRSALRVLARFLRDNRPFLARVFADALCGEPVTRAFIQANAPRHLGVLHALIVQGQRDGTLRRMQPVQAVALCAGVVALPILAGGAMAESGAMPARAASRLRTALLSDDALDERIDTILAALAAPVTTRLRSPKKKNGESP